MAGSKYIEYSTCSFCGEPIRQLVEYGSRGRVRAQTTSHVRHVSDPEHRCKYDDGPYAESHALATFPGDTP
jgi:hypothetical protein